LSEAQLEEYLRRAYNEVLVPVCEAAGDAEDSGFLHDLLDDEYPATQWRFQGCLGFGGKVFFRSDLVLNVDCYREDRNSERDRVIELANTALLKLRSEFVSDRVPMYG
jgi:hypothetical protein